MPRPPPQRRCLTCFDACMIVFGGALCGGALYCATIMYSGIGETIMYAVAGVGGAIFAVNILGLMAICCTKAVRTSTLTTVS